MGAGGAGAGAGGCAYSKNTLDTRFITLSHTLIRDIMVRQSEAIQDYQDQWTEQNVGCLIAQVMISILFQI